MGRSSWPERLALLHSTLLMDVSPDGARASWFAPACDLRRLDNRVRRAGAQVAEGVTLKCLGREHRATGKALPAGFDGPASGPIRGGSAACGRKACGTACSCHATRTDAAACAGVSEHPGVKPAVWTVSHGAAACVTWLRLWPLTGLSGRKVRLAPSLTSKTCRKSDRSGSFRQTTSRSAPSVVSRSRDGRHLVKITGDSP